MYYYTSIDLPQYFQVLIMYADTEKKYDCVTTLVILQVHHLPDIIEVLQ